MDKKQHPLVLDWNKKRNKVNHFKILDDPECPDLLIKRALLTYNAVEVLNVPGIFLRVEFLQDEFLTTVKKITEKNIGMEAIKHTRGPWNGQDFNILNTLGALHSESTRVKKYFFTQIFNKKYLKIIHKNFPSVCEHDKNSHGEHSYTIDMFCKMHAHEYGLRVYDLNELCDDFKKSGNMNFGETRRQDSYIAFIKGTKSMSEETKIKYLTTISQLSNQGKYLGIWIRS